MKKQTSIIFYVLGVYVVLQFCWWGYHLIDLTRESGTDEYVLANRIAMIIGEGLVFFLLLLIGLWKIQSSIKKELDLAERQKNFLLSVTHELKTPVAANKLFWQTIEKRELSVEQRKDITQKALQENYRLEQLIDNILNASRIENNALQIVSEKIDLSTFLNELVDRFNKRNGDEVVNRSIQAQLTINADQFFLETILVNLVENALKYAGSENAIEVYALQKDGIIHIGVKDRGNGVAQEHKDAIFSKFFRGENEETRSKKGTGLGLFIASEFTKALGGKITYTDNLPKGAHFQLTFKP
jgi:K+-sensing histidine kinase KdpD